jgi:Nif-specific regulatory protein
MSWPARGGAVGHGDVDLHYASEVDVPILITGSRDAACALAQRIHDRSRRRGGPFVVVECVSGASSVTELFGAAPEPGGGPPAVRRPLLEAAEGGTIVLVNVEVMSPEFQRSFLALVSGQELQRPRNHRQAAATGIRIISTSSAELVDRVTNGTFPEALFYLLNPIHIYCEAPVN